MRTVLTTLLLVAAAAMTASTPRSAVMTGAAVHSGSHCVVVGEAVAGQTGEAGDYHLTHGQLQGIAVVETTTQEGITEIAKGYAVYPNPVRDILTVSRPDGSAAQLTLTSLAGATVLSHQAREQITSLDLSALPAGLYLLTIRPSAGSPTCTAKIVKL